MTPTLRANLFLAAMLALGGLLQAAPAQAQSTRDQIRMIEDEYARSHGGRPISDAQLEYYLDRMDSGWSMSRISADMAPNTTWRPEQGWAARAVVCSSIGGRYAECPVPFRGTAVLSRQISDSACIEGRSWGQHPGAVWVKDGCRARFAVAGGYNHGPLPPARTVSCKSYKGRYHECATGFRGHVYLSHTATDSRACIEGRSWGQRPGAVWVRGNCRASFSSVGRPGMHDDTTANWTRRPNYAVTCSSIDGRRQVCTWDNRYGTPRVIHQISSGNCVEGRDWGYDRNGTVWVASGCRATFGYADARYSDYGYRNIPSNTFVRDPNYMVTCASSNGQRTVCTWDSRYGNPYLRRSISNAQCVEGRDWGYDVNGGLWVNSGCRGEFSFH